MKKRFCIVLLCVWMLSAFSACGQTGDAPRVVGLELVQPPDKTVYLVGEQFDSSGAVVNARLSDGSLQKNIAYKIRADKPLSEKTRQVSFEYAGESIELDILVTSTGNQPKYAVENQQTLPDSPLRGKVIYWLGSSVTYGSNSGGESMADYIAKKHGAVCIKDAVSGTTLAGGKKDSYVDRLDAYLTSENREEHLDAFVCQLSTNDKGNMLNFGVVTGDDICVPELFRKQTTFGAMEYIIATVRQTWNCPIYFYVNPPIDSSGYEKMVEALEQMAKKWDITIIDMYRDTAFNAISQEERKLYMADSIHPTKAGYLLWWLPKFEEALLQ